jgi:protein phosphatase
VDELLAIGEFSARSGLSAKVLRSYAAAGLLVPAAVDPWTGYRYYAPGQLPEAGLILLLRQAGVPLSEIAAFLRDPGPGQLQRWERALDLEVASRRRALAEARGQLGLLAAATSNPAAQDGGKPMTMMAPGSATDRGEARATNQDALLVSPPLFAVADGMGAPPGGEIASRLALDTLKVRFAAPTAPRRWPRRRVRPAGRSGSGRTPSRRWKAWEPRSRRSPFSATQSRPSLRSSAWVTRAPTCSGTAS